MVVSARRCHVREQVSHCTVCVRKCFEFSQLFWVMERLGRSGRERNVPRLDACRRAPVQREDDREVRPQVDARQAPRFGQNILGAGSKNLALQSRQRLSRFPLLGSVVLQGPSWRQEKSSGQKGDFLLLSFCYESG